VEVIRHQAKTKRTACFDRDQEREKCFVTVVFVENLGKTIASVNYVICATGLLITREFSAQRCFYHDVTVPINEKPATCRGEWRGRWGRASRS
jgi:hypothetical protein